MKKDGNRKLACPTKTRVKVRPARATILVEERTVLADNTPLLYPKETTVSLTSNEATTAVLAREHTGSN